MDLFLSLTVNGLLLGSLYALVAIGYALIFGVLRIVYLAHGQIVMVGAYAGLVAFTADVHIAGALTLAALVGAALGYVIERFTVRPLGQDNVLMPLVTTISVGVILEEIIRLSFSGGQMVRYPDEAINADALVQIGFVRITAAQVFVFATAMILLTGVAWAVRRTWGGRGVRATASHREVARMLGVNLERVSSRTFMVACALAAIAGTLFGYLYAAFDPYFGGIIGLKVIAIILLGGLGSLYGAGLAAFLLGLIEAFAAGYLPAAYIEGFTFLLVMVVITFRPAGLLGKRSIVRT